VIFARQGWTGDIPAELAARAILVPDFSEPISATWVRSELAAGKSCAESVPAAVLAFIEQHGLYRTATEA